MDLLFTRHLHRPTHDCQRDAGILINKCEGKADVYAWFQGICVATGQRLIKLTVFHLILWKRLFFSLYFPDGVFHKA